MLRAALLVTVFSAASVPAYADWYATPFAGATFGTSTNFVDIDQAARSLKFVFGGGATLLGPGVIGVDGEFSLVPGFFQRDDQNRDPVTDPCCLVVKSRVTTLMGNVVVAAPEKVTGYGLRPYALAGAGLMRATASDLFDAVPFERNLFAINVGGGLIGPLSDKRAVRFDLRYFRNIRTVGEGSLRGTRPVLGFWRGSVGLMFKL